MSNREMVSLDADRAGQLWLVALNYIEYQNATARMIEDEDAEDAMELLPGHYRFVAEVLEGLMENELTSDQYDRLSEWEAELDQVKVQRGNLRVYASLNRALCQADYDYLARSMKREWAHKYPNRPLSLFQWGKGSRQDVVDIAIDVSVEEDTEQNVLCDLLLILNKRKMKATHQSVQYY